MRYITNEQRRRRTLFKPTLWAVASWLIFHVAHSLHIDLDMLVVRALKISQLTDGGMPPTYDSMHWFTIEDQLRPRQKVSLGSRFAAIDKVSTFIAQAQRFRRSKQSL